MPQPSLNAVAVLSGAGAGLRRPTTAQRVAEILRERILLGELPSGTSFREQRLTAAFGVSRHTVREAFQILVAERLVVHEPHRGIFVRRLAPADVRDIYSFRRLVECAALLRPDRSDALADLRAAVTQGRKAAERGNWQQVGTADVRFHIAVTALSGSERLNRAMRAVLAELRLAFQLVPDAQALHAPFLDLNIEIADLVEGRRPPEASSRMEAYLDQAETAVLAAVASGEESSGTMAR
ncbi:MAG TPA: GntR family transcriptional regulator [Actinomycetales bacterium]|nr:GntR family transcriptional regulator [Actinomycetales bacterium]